MWIGHFRYLLYCVSTIFSHLLNIRFKNAALFFFCVIKSFIYCLTTNEHNVPVLYNKHTNSIIYYDKLFWGGGGGDEGEGGGGGP